MTAVGVYHECVCAAQPHPWGMLNRYSHKDTAGRRGFSLLSRSLHRFAREKVSNVLNSTWVWHRTTEGAWLPACLHEWICVPISMHDTNKMGTHSHKCGSVVQSVVKSTWGYLYLECFCPSTRDLGFVLAVVGLCCQGTQSRTITIHLEASLAKTEYKCNFYVTGSGCGKLVIVVGI